MSDRSIIEFLIRAKKATYAGKGAEIASSRPNSHDLKYSEGNLMYLDSYLGSSSFVGEEAIWIYDLPYWSMNYAGRVTGDNFSGDFLKDALSNVPLEYPFRGPLTFTSGDYSYNLTITGDFSWFNGHEIISYKGEEIYDCYIHGSLVKS